MACVYINGHKQLFKLFMKIEGKNIDKIMHIYIYIYRVFVKCVMHDDFLCLHVIYAWKTTKDIIVKDYI